MKTNRPLGWRKEAPLDELTAWLGAKLHPPMRTFATLTVMFLVIGALFAICWPLVESLQASDSGLLRVAGALLGTIGLMGAMAGVCALVAYLVDHHHHNPPDPSDPAD